MTRPSENELESAIAIAEQMCDENNDPDLIAKSLLSEHYRAEYLQEVFSAADRYINHGMAESERTHLLRTIEKAKEMEDHSTRQNREDFGLE
jgi:hypothetical protein